jgi:putative ATP-binding cassette transporter
VPPSSASTAAAPPPLRPRARARRRRRIPGLSIAAWRQFYAVARPYWVGDRRTSAWAMLALIVAMMLAETQLAVMLNDRSGEMMSALAAREADRFWAAVRACLLVIVLAVPIYAWYYYLRDQFSNHWRRWLTGRFLDGYLGARHYYALNGHPEIDNPDQRISEDINSFTGRSIHYLLILLGALMQLVAFSAVLWGISKPLVAFLAVYACVGTVVALWVFGTPLIRLNFWQLQREADFRFGLMRLRENAESIAFYRGEAQERTAIDRQFDAAYGNYSRLIKKQRTLNLYQRAFSQLTLVLPSVILAGSVLSGELEVGRAVQAGGAFLAVLSAVALIVDNFEGLSRFVAGIDRLHALARVLLPDETRPLPAPPAGAGPATATPTSPAAPAAAAAANAPPPAQIERRVGRQLALRSVDLYTPGGERLLLQGLTLTLAPGQALLICGASGCGKSSLLRAVAGLWRTGRGLIEHPPMDEMLFLPQRPYLQVGSLRSQLAYPATQSSLDDAQLLAVLDSVQLPGLAERVGGLDAVHDWEKLLSTGEQQRLGFARVLVHRPPMAILDEATSALDSANEALLYARLRESGTTVVSVAHRSTLLKHHTHVLELAPGGAWSLQPASGFRLDE